MVHHEALLPNPSGPKTKPVQVFGLGPFRIAPVGGKTVTWQLTKALTLLPYLLDRRDLVVERSTLIGTFWSEGSARAPETSLKVAVHGLRQALAKAFGDQPPISIETHRLGYLLRADEVWYDVAEFERCASRAGRLDRRGDTDEATEGYRHAVQLYSGEFLSGYGGDWIVRRRQTIVDRYLLALMRLANAELAVGDYESCLSHCAAALELDACCEWAYQILMLCHAELGQLGRVHSWRELCASTLRNILGIQPSGPTEQLYRRLADAGRELTTG